MYQKIIIKPILTEKMAILEERENKFAFLVSSGANKTEIKKAVELKFEVKVAKVAKEVEQQKSHYGIVECHFRGSNDC